MTGSFCWFCGLPHSYGLTRGLSVGEMVFSVPGRVSDPDLYWNEVPDLEAHFDSTRGQICRECALRFGQELPPLDLQYLAQCDDLVRRIEAEADDVAVGLIEEHERAYHFFCWFDYLNPTQCQKMFWSLPLGELIERGLTIVGASVFENSGQISQFIERFGLLDFEPTRSAVHVIENHFTLPNNNLSRGLGKVRCVISDTALYKRTRLDS